MNFPLVCEKSSQRLDSFQTLRDEKNGKFVSYTGGNK